jgi:glutamine synthetase
MAKDIFLMNPLEQFLKKPKRDFSKEDIIRFINYKDIQLINFHYVGGDGRIKTLNFPLQSKKQLDNILSYGERVDGSSLFKHVETGSSDLYVVPKFRTAFINPFTEIPTLGLLCQYFDKDGTPMAGTPDNILAKADKMLKEKTGFTLEAMGELEYYVVSEKEDLFHAKDQRGYHESSPFTKWENIRSEAIFYLNQMGCHLKYGHSEVGNFSDEFYNYEQNELEFLPVSLEEAAEEVVLGKWVLRHLAYQYGVNLSFAPKITVGKAGSGLHVHMRLLKDGKPMMGAGEELSQEAIKAIGGILELSPSLTAFGNTVPTSYLRLVPHQEAPTNICWGYRNRSALVRVPLGWAGKAADMIKVANPDGGMAAKMDIEDKRTFEFRCPDGSADIYLLLAGLAVAVRKGLTSKTSLKYALDRYIDVNIFKEEHKKVQSKLEQLPVSCFESAEYLMKQKSEYLKFGVFDESIIVGAHNMLKGFDDKKLSERLYGKHEEIKKLVFEHINC